MLTMKIPVLVLTALLLAAPAFAADVDGKWAGNISTPMGDVQVGFQFKADGATLTGTTTGPDGSMVTLKNGKIDGSKISFTVTFDFGGMPIDIAYTGDVAPPEIKLTADFAGMPFQFVVKKTE
jgi:hypothetical protein